MDLASLLAPRDSALTRLAEDVYRTRPDLQAAFPDPRGAEFRQWLGVYGLLENPAVAAFYPALPPEELRATVCGGRALPSHLRTGAEDFRSLAELFEVFAARSIESVRTTLDFGCGCGRLVRWFETALPHAHHHGADVRVAAIDWCRQNLRGTFLANGTMPPLALPDASIDFTFALSVFSHLSAEQSLHWMRELVRVTKPDGLVLVSTHGTFALALCSRSPEHQHLLKMDAATARELLRELPRRHFLHRVSPAASRLAADGVADDYGQAFFDEIHAREAWAGFAEYLGCVPCGLNLFQDFHAVRPRQQ
jgi:SAM-dependent methyltransferase